MIPGVPHLSNRGVFFSKPSRKYLSTPIKGMSVSKFVSKGLFFCDNPEGLKGVPPM
jgi:hypothetical protein